MGKAHTQAFVLDDGETEIEVEYTVSPGSPAVLYGDYPHPGDDPEVEIERARLMTRCEHGGWYVIEAEIALTDAETARIESEIAENPEWWADTGPDPDDWRDAEIDRRLCERDA